MATVLITNYMEPLYPQPADKAAAVRDNLTVANNPSGQLAKAPSPQPSTAPPPPPPTTTADCTHFIRRQLGQAEIFRGLPLNNEYELIPYNHFTFSRVYPIELGLGKRVVEKPIGYKRKDLLHAINKALDSLNRQHPKLARPDAPAPAKRAAGRFTLDDFVEGVYRIDPTTGTQYEMYFRTRDGSHHGVVNRSSSLAPGITKVVVWRPFGPIQTVQTEHAVAPREKELVYIILPLCGRTESFQAFMDKFVRIALKNDRRVHLTVVYFGEDGLAEARAIMSRVLAQRNSGATAANLKLLALNETFSRGECERGDAEIWQTGRSYNRCFFCLLGERKN